MLKELLIFVFTLSLMGCYSFKGISIPPEVNSFTVNLFENNAYNSAPTLGQTLSETLRTKILSDTRLSYAQSEGDVEFSGVITSYRISPINPKPGETDTRNQLQISVRIEYTCPKNEKSNWSQTFSRNAEYNSSEDLTSIQDQLISEINELLVDQIFNKAFAQW